MPEEKDAEIMTPYEDYSVDELKEAYKKLFFLSDLNDADLAEMEHILAILREKDPLPPTRSVDELWEEFQSVYMKEPADIGIRNYAESEEVSAEEPVLEKVSAAPSEETAAPARPKRRRKLLRIALLAAALVVIMAAITATAAAMGYNLWGWLPVWGKEDVRFVSETPAQEPDEDDLQDIPMVLASLGITEPLYPTWLPEDFSRVETITSLDPVFLHESYKGNDRELTITISQHLAQNQPFTRRAINIQKSMWQGTWSITYSTIPVSYLLLGIQRTIRSFLLEMYPWKKWSSSSILFMR